MDKTKSEGGARNKRSSRQEGVNKRASGSRFSFLGRRSVGRASQSNNTEDTTPVVVKSKFHDNPLNYAAIRFRKANSIAVVDGPTLLQMKELGRDTKNEDCKSPTSNGGGAGGVVIGKTESGRVVELPGQAPPEPHEHDGEEIQRRMRASC